MSTQQTQQTERKLQIPFKFHEGQLRFHCSTARFRLLACGRRWGKTKVGAVETILQALKAPEGSVIYCVAPTFSHSRKQWKEILYYLPHQLITRINRAEHVIEVVGNREFAFKSADSPDSMRGDRVYFAWLDEGSLMAEERWTHEIRPALMDTRGGAIFTGTPKGKNWYFQLFIKGQEKRDGFESWCFSSYTNPYLDRREIDEFRATMPELAFRQEILAEFLDDVGSVFRNVRAHIAGTLEEPSAGKAYYMGVDLAKTRDFTVICVLDNDGHLCAFDRFSQLDWVFQLKRIENLALKYRARVVIDSSGVGDPIYDALRRRGLNVSGFKFTNETKKDLIENLSLMLDNGQITYPDVPVLVNELQLFGYTVSPGGVIRYTAPEGYHDDCVIALALAAWPLQQPKPNASFLLR